MDINSSDFNGIAEIHPSIDISNKDAEFLSLEASRRYMTKKDYFDLKSFSYYPRIYSYNDFETDVKECSESKLPFSLE